MKHGAAEAITSRDVQAATRSAWRASGAADFKLDIVHMGDNIIVYTKSVAGRPDPNCAWHVSWAEDGTEFKVEHFSGVDGKHPGKLENTYYAQDLAELEGFLTDEVKDLQETLNEA